MFKSIGNKGMTIIEILVVLTLLAGLSALFVTTIMARFQKSKLKTAKILVSQVAGAIDMFYLDCSYYPSNQDGLEALVSAPERCESWGPEPYLKNGKIPRDPWKNDLVYNYDESTGKYTVISLGKDGREGGEGLSADISSADL